MALQSAIFLLGFSLSIGRVAEVSGDSLWLVAAYVLGVLSVGFGLARVLRLERVSGLLITAGTAICGGTAIATLAPLAGARADQVGVAIGIVFLLNALALFGFPVIGHCARHESGAVRHVGGAGDSRYEFGAGDGGDLRQRSAPSGDDGQAGPDAMADPGRAGRQPRLQAVDRAGARTAFHRRIPRRFGVRVCRAAARVVRPRDGAREQSIAGRCALLHRQRNQPGQHCG